MTELRVNSIRFATSTSPRRVPTLAIEIGSNALFADGVLVFGDRYYPQKGAKGRAANQFYTRAPVPMF